MMMNGYKQGSLLLIINIGIVPGFCDPILPH